MRILAWPRRSVAAGGTALALLVSGCATLNYTSQKPAREVSQCIAQGWRHVPPSGVEAPSSLEKEGDDDLVQVVLVRDFPTFIALPSVSARVRDNASGSATTYRRNFQIAHERLDKVVAECQ